MRTTSRRSIGLFSGLIALVIAASTGVGVAATPDADRLAAGPVKVVPVDDDGDLGFGSAVDIDGDTMVVGAGCATTRGGNCDGVAFVFVRSGSSWTQQARLESSDLAKFDFFGRSVAVSGDTIVIGASDDSTGSVDYHGSAYVFTRSGTTWTQRAKLTTPNGLADNDQFGISVDIDANTVVVGAPSRDSAGALRTGMAYVFERAGSTWPLQAELRATDRATGDYFGASVALEGSTVLAGAQAADTSAGAHTGAAYAYTRTGSTWQQTAKIVPADAATDMSFGVTVALDGETAAIAYGFGGRPSRYGVYVFVGSGSSWTQQAKLIPRNGTEFDEFGSAIDLSGDLLAVGAPEDSSKLSDQGAAYVFSRSDSTWVQRVKLTGKPRGVGDYFGSDVAVDGMTLAAGNPGEDQVYVYQR